MSLYYEAAALIQDDKVTSASLKPRVYSNKTLKSKPAHIFALISNATRWSHILKAVIEQADILKIERKLTPSLALLLTHDLLLSKDGIAAPKNHVLKVTINKHKARLGAEFARARVKAGFASTEAWRTHLDEALEVSNSKLEIGVPKVYKHPRWIRINTLKSSKEEELGTTFAGYEQVSTLDEVLHAAPTAKLLKIDDHIPNLLALPPGADFSKSKSYNNGKLIFQDKASCMPAYLLDYHPAEGDCIDACAAPGNKTTHLAAIAIQSLHIQSPSNPSTSPRSSRIWACERDKQRSITLQKMVTRASADSMVTCLAAQDFLDLDPAAPKWSHVSALLLDPSCSGSGIVGRDDDDDETTANEANIALPSLSAPQPTTTAPSRHNKKRKRHPSPSPSPPPSPTPPPPSSSSSSQTHPPSTSDPLQTRLAALSAFQTHLLTHAMSFPAARKIAYSTCSVHAAENEAVVLRALAAPVAARRGWRVLRRDEQVVGMRAWERRGDARFCEGWEGGGDGDGDEDGAGNGRLGRRARAVVAEACVRCEKGTGEGTMGFFVVGLVRGVGDGDGLVEDGGEEGEQEEEEEEVWEGLSD